MSTTSCGINENGTLTKDRAKIGHIGDIIAFYGSTAPEGTLVCNGAAISRTTYSELFGVIGTTAGAGDGSTTFNLPDLRGLFLRGLNGANAAGLGVEQGDAIREIAGHAPFRAYKGVLSSNNQTLFNGEGAIRHVIGEASIGGSEGPQGVAYATGSNWGNEDLNFAASRVVPTAAENRPVNTAVLYCMIYE